MAIQLSGGYAQCAQIRAASLSGDCTFKQELLRGNYGIRGQHQVGQCIFASLFVLFW